MAAILAMSAPLVPERLPLDTIFTRIGLGPYQFFSLLFIGCCYISESMMNVFGYVLSNATQSQWNLSSWEVTAVAIARDVGVIITGLTIPWLGDKYGRRTTVRWGLLIKMAALFMACMSVYWEWLFLCLFIVGLSLGFCRPANGALCIEMLQPRFRGALLVGQFVFIISGAIGGAAAAIYVVPMFRPEHWRMLLFLANIPNALGLFAINCMFLESPRFLAMVDKKAQAVKVFNRVARFNCRPELSPDEVALVKNAIVKPPPYNYKESFRRILLPKYKSKLMYMLLMWFLTGYQNSALLNSFPRNLTEYLNNPLMAVEISTLPIAIFIPLPVVEMPGFGRRWTLFGFQVIQLVSSFIATVTTNQIVFVGALLTLLFSVTFSFRFLYPMTLELFDTSIRCYTFGLCFAIARIGGLCSRWQDTVIHDPGMPVMLCMNFIGIIAIIHYPYETVLKPLDDYEELS